MFKYVATCLSSLIYKSRRQMHWMIHCLYLSLNVNAYEMLYYCNIIKEDHNAEKASLVTTFGFEIKIMDKCCVCGKQLWISIRLQTRPVWKQNELCCFCTAYVMDMDCIRTAYGICVKCNMSDMATRADRGHSSQCLFIPASPRHVSEAAQKWLSVLLL